MPCFYGGCISIWMCSGLGCGVAAMDSVVSCLGFFSFLFLLSWDSYSYSAVSLGVCYKVGVCIGLSVDLLHSVGIKKNSLCKIVWVRCDISIQGVTCKYLHVRAYYLVPVVWWYLQMCICGGRFPCTVLVCCSLRACCSYIYCINSVRNI